MTAPSTCRSRSVRGVVISAKPFHANNLRSGRTRGQVTHQGVETQPPLRSAPYPSPALLDPPLPFPGGQAVGRTIGLREPFFRPQRQVQPLQFLLLGGEHLLGFHWGAAGLHCPSVCLPGREVPASRPAVERVGGRAEAEVGPT